jgi:hypothetical protein
VTTTATRPSGLKGSPVPQGQRKGVWIAVIVVVLLAAASLGIWLVTKGGGTPASAPPAAEASEAPGATAPDGGGNGGGNAFDRVVPDSDTPTVASIVGLWAKHCSAADDTGAAIETNGSGYYKPAGGNLVGWKVQSTAGGTVAIIQSSADPSLPRGTSVRLTVQGGKLTFTVGGTTVALFPYSTTYNGPIC